MFTRCTSFKLRGMWTGVVPSMQRAFVVNAAELASYDYIKGFFLHKALLEDGILCHFVSSMITGLIASVCASPVDVTKTRLMNQKHGKERVFSGMIDCIIKTSKNEGILALYKGFIPLWMRIGPWCVAFFISYEQYRQFARAVWDHK